MDDKVLQRTVQDIPKAGEDARGAGSQSLVLYINNFSNTIEAWGRNWVRRDEQLRKFWPTEPFLASAISSVVMTRAALSWELTGPPKSVARIQEILNNSDFGKGWQSLMIKLSIDIATQDNGGFLEVIRDKPKPGQKPESAPVLGLGYLASSSCLRTGNPREPVIYVDAKGGYHRLRWYQVITFEEIPVGLPESPGIDRQICFVSRVLKAAEIVKDINIYHSEKVSGRFARAIHLVGGVAQHEIENIQKAGQLDADNSGLQRYLQPLILAALDPNAKVSHEQIDLASLPDAFDWDVLMKWYISLIAMAAGGDFQDFAPLPGGNLGTASQSETLHRKSQRKGHALWMKMIEHKLQAAKVIPPNVSFRFMQQDAAAELEQVELSATRATTRQVLVESGQIDINVARQMAVDDGDLKQEYLVMMGDVDQTPSITLPDDGVLPDVLEDKEVSITISYKTANWWRKLVEQHKLHSVNPIQESKLNTFEQALTHLIKKQMTLGTTELWQDHLITLAAQEAGIQPHVLRMRLPDSYKVYITENKVYDSIGNIIYIKPEAKGTIKVVKSQKAKNETICYICSKEKVAYVYMPGQQWKPVCQDHYNRGLLGKQSQIQYNFGELQQAFIDQSLAILEPVEYNNRKDKLSGLFLSALMYSYSLGLGRNLVEKEVDEVKEEFRKQAIILPYLQDPNPLVMSLMTFYLKGLSL